MRLTSLAIPLTLALAAPAFSQTPPEVLTAYKAYNAAYAAKDYPAALKEGKAAWKAAEKSMGDSKTTGDLAFNYGFLAKSQGLAEDAITPLERSIELAVKDTDQGAAVRLERSVELIAAAEASGKSKSVQRYVDDALELAQSNGLQSSVFAGEVLVHKAAECSRKVNRAAQRLIGKPTSSRLDIQTDQKGRVAKEQKLCSKDAQEASVIFKNNPKMARPKYVALAAKQTGFAFERDEDWLKAALSYQEARLAIEDTYGRDNPVVMQMIGRWINARSRLSFGGKLEMAKAAGLCDCWPFDTENAKVRPVKRVEPDVPRNAIEIKSSGVVVLKADISDAGVPQSIQVVYSWPEGEYDAPALAAYEQFTFAPKAAGEAPAARKNVIENFSFIMYNDSTRETY